MDTKQAFADRLVRALDLAGVEKAKAARKRFLARIADISERHAGNYLNAEKLPTTGGMIELAEKLHVSAEWLMTGRGLERPLSPQEVEHIRRIRSLSESNREFVYRLEFGVRQPLDGGDPVHAA